MKNMHPEVLVLPELDGEGPCRGYSRSQAEALQGRSFATLANGSVRIGKVVGSYAYRYGSRRVEYGLETEFKLNGGKDIWKGSLNRADLEVDGSTTMLRGQLAKEVAQQMQQKQEMSRAVVKCARQEVKQSQAMRVNQGQGFSM